MLNWRSNNAKNQPAGTMAKRKRVEFDGPDGKAVLELGQPTKKPNTLNVASNDDAQVDFFTVNDTLDAQFIDAASGSFSESISTALLEATNASVSEVLTATFISATTGIIGTVTIGEISVGTLSTQTLTVTSTLQLPAVSSASAPSVTFGSNASLYTNTSGLFATSNFSALGGQFTVITLPGLSTASSPSLDFGSNSSIYSNTSGMFVSSTFSGAGAHFTALTLPALSTASSPSLDFGTNSSIYTNTSGMFVSSTFSGLGSQFTSITLPALSTASSPSLAFGTNSSIYSNTSGMFATSNISAPGAAFSGITFPSTTTIVAPALNFGSGYVLYNDMAGLHTTANLYGQFGTFAALQLPSLSTFGSPAIYFGSNSALYSNTSGLFSSTDVTCLQLNCLGIDSNGPGNFNSNPITAGNLTLSGALISSSTASFGTNSLTAGPASFTTLATSGASTFADVTMTGNLSFEGATGQSLDVTSLSVLGQGATASAVTTSTFTGVTVAPAVGHEYGFQFSVSAPIMVSAVGLLQSCLGTSFPNPRHIRIWDQNTGQSVGEALLYAANPVGNYYTAEFPLVTLIPTSVGFPQQYTISVGLYGDGPSPDKKSTAPQTFSAGWTSGAAVTGLLNIIPTTVTGDPATSTMGLNMWGFATTVPAMLIDASSYNVIFNTQIDATGALTVAGSIAANGGLQVTGGETVDNLTVTGSLSFPGYFGGDWMIRQVSASQSIPAGTPTNLPYDTSVQDGPQSSSTYAIGAFMANVAGLYHIRVSCEWAATGTAASRDLYFFTSDLLTDGRSTIQTVSGSVRWQTTSALIYLAVGHSVGVFVINGGLVSNTANPSASALIQFARVG